MVEESFFEFLTFIVCGALCLFELTFEFGALVDVRVCFLSSLAVPEKRGSLSPLASNPKSGRVIISPEGNFSTAP